MTRLLTAEDVKHLIQTKSLKTCLLELIAALHHSFSKWSEFQKVPRLATYLPQGVIELMPICDPQYYAYKYTSGYPNNPNKKHNTVIAVGMLSATEDSYPLLISDMTLLTALRTAATSALASQYLARPHAQSLGIIGTGAQSEFQALALKFALDIHTLYYFDCDPEAMQKFANNLSPYGFKLIPCTNSETLVKKADVIVTATAHLGHTHILNNTGLQPGTHINAIGGDAPGKTELDPAILSRSKIIVEYNPQSKIEGEIQQTEQAPYAELWELVTQQKPGRTSDQEITLFDSVGFAIEDHAVLKYFHTLAQDLSIGQTIDIVPPSSCHPKDLFGWLYT